eukprot:g9717.t1
MTGSSSGEGVGGGRDSCEEPTIPFPFEPYDVQKQLMRKIYTTIETAGIGIFESPTGTGKSLSVICSALQWLKDAEAKDVDGNATPPTTPGSNAKGSSTISTNGGSSVGQAGGKTAANGAAGDDDDDDDDGDSAMPSWLKDLTRQKSENEREARAKRIQDRRRELDRRLAAVRKQQGHDKANLSRVRGVHRHGGGGGGGGIIAGGVTRDGRRWSSRTSFLTGTGGGGGGSRKRPRPQQQPSSSSGQHGKSAAAGPRGSRASSAGWGRGSGEGTTDRTEEGEAEAAGDDEFLVAEYDSGNEGGGGGGGGDGGRESSDEEGHAGGEEDVEEEWADLGLRQILYVSRTHSQTSQFVNEVKKTSFAQGVRCASLGSRRTLCGNEQVASLKTDGKMRDACLDLQKNKKKDKRKKDKVEVKDKNGRKTTTTMMKKKNKTDGGKNGKGGQGRGPGREEDESDGDEAEEEDTGDGCPLLTSEGQREFPYRALATVRDIEELAELGKQDGTCSYYGARKAAALAQLVVMPYAALLSREARGAMGVRLEGAVVIVDEAHNIVEAINSVHSKKLVLSEVARAHSQLSQYEARYSARLKGSNAFYVGNVLRLLRAMLKFLTKGKEKLKAVRAEKTAAAGTRAKEGGPGRRDGAVEAQEEKEEAARSEMLEINDFLFRAGLDNVNLFKLQRYMRRSEISRKVMGFMDLSPEVTLQAKPLKPSLSAAKANGSGNQGECSNAAEATGGPAEGTSVGAAGLGAGGDCGGFVSKHFSALQTVEGFLDALTNASRDGRVLATYGGREADGSSARAAGAANANKQRGQPQQRGQQQQDEEEPSLKFLMLNPSVHFDEIVQKARALVLVGGTMQPTGDLVRQLFSSVEPSRVEIFSCGHVIPKENLLPLSVSRGPSGKTFNFTFHRRGTEEQVDELGRLMTNVCKLVPGGVVCFLASYGYLDQVLQRWKASGTLRQLNKHKSVFSEPRSAKDVDAVLKDFSLAARAGAWEPSGDGGSGGGSSGGGGGGALLLSVVGAKMSEGINFSDDLARCVVMVGLPYPDRRDPELKQKMAYLDEASPDSRGRAGREYYSSICMRAVNQSIGRSIRHAGDYATILLVDERYRDEQVVRLLPGWIGERVVKPDNFGQSFVALRRFFAHMHARKGGKS